MEKIIRLQDARFKLLSNNNNETSIFVEQSIANSLGLNDGDEHIFKINKENILKALSFTYSFQKSLYKKQEIIFLDSDWFKKEYDLIINHFQTTSDYKVEISKATGDRFYMKSLKQSNGFNIRNFLIQDHFKIIFSKSNNDLILDYSYEPYSLDSETGDLFNETNSQYNLKNVSDEFVENEILISNKKLRVIIFESYLYVRNLIDESQLLNGYELKDSTIDTRVYKGLTVPKYFNFEVLIGMFTEEQAKDDLKSSNTIRFIDKKIKTLNFENSYFTSQWNESNGRGLSLGNFNAFLKDVSNNTLEIIKVAGIFKLIRKKIFNHLCLNKIFYGAPGTGKSYKVNNLVEGKDNRMQRVTFHPEFDYASFIGGYKPTMANEDGKEVIKYKFVPQAFTNMYVKAWNDINNDYYLVIEEINRGNCAEIFGDIFQLLDRDSDYDITPSIELEGYLKSMLVDENKGLEKGKLKLPINLTIYATMNTSDQSLFPMDSAFKRRWDWEYIPICYKGLTDEGKPNPSFDYVIDLGNGTSFNWNDFISKVNLNHIQQNPVLGMDKCMGNYFVKPKKGKTTINVETFINKAIFYLWNDVFKDEKNEVFEENSSYEDFFPIKTKGVQKLTELLERIEVTINTTPEESAPVQDEVTN